MTPGELILVASPGSDFATAETGNGITLTTGNKAFFQPTRPVAVIRWGFICLASVGGAAGGSYSLDFHPLVGTAGGQVLGLSTQLQAQTGWNASTLPAFYVDLAGGTITIPNGTTLAAGKGVFHQIAPQQKMPPTDSSTNPVPSPDTAFVAGGGVATIGLTVYPGQELCFDVQSAPTSTGPVNFFIHYYPLDFVSAFANYENVASGIPAGITPMPSDPGNFTRFLS